MHPSTCSWPTRSSYYVTLVSMSVRAFKPSGTCPSPSYKPGLHCAYCMQAGRAVKSCCVLSAPFWALPIAVLAAHCRLPSLQRASALTTCCITQHQRSCVRTDPRRAVLSNPLTKRHPSPPPLISSSTAPTSALQTVCMNYVWLLCACTPHLMGCI